ncbi:PREDICTED: thioredoxin domain-containing protein 11 [Gekko japonicus]|uniref:Thioredoxin domain-containing protein 11 n=1 Tax=Gekko japonicus TaxID=146911 RepID=A0ABM1JVA7_GEKJA|nr:PREDICTED: thioredoxin domain-containing protein 11 [Gekko japonicus]
MPAKLPVNFFSSTSPVVDFFLGQLDHAELVRRDSEVSLFFFYAPWCGQSLAAREDIEKVASSLADQVLFVAINCWWNQGKCRKQKHFFHFPVIYLYHRSFGPIEYKGPLNAVYIEKFVRRVMRPLLYISSPSRLQRFLSSYEPGVLGYFEFNASPQPPGYLTFFASALHSLNKDYLGTVHFGVITDKLIAKEIPLTNSGSVYLHRHVNASLLFPHEAMNYTAENVCRWALKNQETFVRWLRPHGGKSLLLNNELKKGPALLLFLPFDPLAEDQPLVDEISSLALAYNRCNRSGPGGPGTDRLGGGGGGETSPATGPFPPAEPFPISQSPCCNTVVLPPQPPAISRTHNVCELCVNQTVGVQPSWLGGLHCSFFEIEAALDSFYLKERTFVQVVSKTAALCSNFLSSYSPFSYYTACCRTVDGGVRSLLFGSPKTPPPLPPGVAFPSHGKRWEEEPPRSMPHIEDRRGLSLDITGLSCRTNKTLNLYLLDSNLFWMYAERLGAPRLAPTKEFAAIVDLKEEAHFVLGQSRALVRPHLETFIQNYSVLYSPLRRHLMGSQRSARFGAQHRIREVATDTFQEVVLMSDKDVLLLYYAPWCGFCVALNHIFIQLARILPDNFVVARVDVSQNDLPWEFMTDHLPNILFFPRQRKDQSVKFPEEFPVTLPNLLRFLLRHSSPRLQECRVSLLEREIQQLRAEIRALREAQALLQAQLAEARKEERRLLQESRVLQKQHEALQSQREHLQGLCDRKSRELQGLAGKLQELAEASKTLLAENALLRVLLAAAAERGTTAEPDSSPTREEEEEEEDDDDSTRLEATMASERSRENWTEQPT